MNTDETAKELAKVFTKVITDVLNEVIEKRCYLALLKILNEIENKRIGDVCSSI
jgi:hypothetical protein